MSYEFEPIGVIHSCFKEKFGIPRQPGLVSEARAVLELLPPYDRAEALRDLEQFSHLWLIFVFHQALREQWRPTVRPPRLGGNRRSGVFATRAPFRPNPIGLSAVELERIEHRDGKLLLHLKGVDVLDGTPVLDIKPYLPYADAIAQARGGFAAEAPGARIAVEFSAQALEDCRRREHATQPALQALIAQLLQADPRPAYQSEISDGQIFGMRLFDFDIKWEMRDGVARVLALEDCATPSS